MKNTSAKGNYCKTDKNFNMSITVPDLSEDNLELDADLNEFFGFYTRPNWIYRTFRNRIYVLFIILKHNEGDDGRIFVNNPKYSNLRTISPPISGDLHPCFVNLNFSDLPNGMPVAVVPIHEESTFFGEPEVRDKLKKYINSAWRLPNKFFGPGYSRRNFQKFLDNMNLQGFINIRPRTSGGGGVLKP